MSSQILDGSASVARLSCEQCRHRKLKCDRIEPRCNRCIKLGDECVYPRTRRRPGGKKRLGIRELETRLVQLEGELEKAKRSECSSAQTSEANTTPSSLDQDASSFELSGPSPPTNENTENTTNISELGEFVANELLGFDILHGVASLRLREELISIYFEKVHSITPILHPSRYKQSLQADEFQKPPWCLQHIVLAHAASNSESHSALALPFYHRAKNCLEQDELKQGENYMTLAHVQTWLLMANFEAQQTMFMRASSSQCRGLRLAQMLGLHQVDHEDSGTGSNLELPQWAILEEQRRTWWAIYCTDRFLYGTTGWPSLVEDDDIFTFLPASEEAFENNRPELTSSLHHLLESRSQDYSALTGRVLVARLFYNTMRHTFSSQPENRPDAIQHGKHWETHRQLDNELTILLLSFPSQIKLPQNFQCQNAIFANIMVQTAIICLNRTAVSHMRKSPQCPEYLLLQCQERIIPATEQIVSIFRMVPDLEFAFRNPVIIFSVYLAAQVYLEDYVVMQSSRSRDALDFLLSVVVLFSKYNAVADSLSKQLAADMQQHGINSPLVSQVNALVPCPMLATPLLGRTKLNSSAFAFNPLA